MGIPTHGFLAIKLKAKIFAAGLVLIALVSTLLWFGRGMFVSEKAIENKSGSAAAVPEALSAAASQAGQDSDGDGLKNWEETLLRTDPKSPDTDGDGTPDGEEIAKNRDPLKKGPNDRIELPTAQTSDSAPMGNLTYDLTASLLKSGVLGAIDQQGRIASRDFLKNLELPKTLDLNALLKADTFTAKDLTLGTRSAPETILEYFKSVEAISQKHLAPFDRRGDLLILVEYLQTGNAKKLTELDPIISALDRAIEDLRKLPVPPGYQVFALRELGYLAKTKHAIEITRNTARDPLATAIIIRLRIDLLTEMANFHRETAALLQARGIAENPG